MQQIANAFLKHLAIVVLALSVSCLRPTTALAGERELTIGVFNSSDSVGEYAQIFRKIQPDVNLQIVSIHLDLVSKYGGREIADLLSAKYGIDIIWGLRLSTLKSMWQSGVLLDEYQPPVSGSIQRIIDIEGPWQPVALDYVALCVNEHLLKKRGLSQPDSWWDLTRRKYADQILMANPNYDSAAAASISAWLDIFGGYHAGWQYMDALHRNVYSYPSSSRKVCERVAAGQVPIGIASVSEIYLKSSSSLRLIVPAEGTGLEVFGMAILRDARNKNLAAEFMGWWAYEGSNILESQNIILRNALKYAQIIKPLDIDEVERRKLLSEWSYRYDAKTEW